MLHHNNVQDRRSFHQNWTSTRHWQLKVCELIVCHLHTCWFKRHISSPGVCLTLCLSLGLGFTDWDNQSRRISHYRIRTCRHVKICKFARHLWDLCPYLHLSRVQIWKFTADNHARHEANFPPIRGFCWQIQKMLCYALFLHLCLYIRACGLFYLSTMSPNTCTQTLDSTSSSSFWWTGK